MRRAGRTAALAVALAISSGAVAAQNWDAELSYAARDDAGAGSGENDFARVSAGYAWPALDGRLRSGIELGLRNDDHAGDQATMAGLELTFARRVGNNRFAFGGRVRNAEGRTTTGELLYGVERFGGSFDLRGVIGLQGLSDTADVEGRAKASAVALGEASFWLTTDLVASAGLSGEADGGLYTLGVEWRPRGASYGLFLDWGQAIDEYRDVAGYADLSGGIR